MEIFTHTKKQKKERKTSSSSIFVVYFYITFRDTQHIVHTHVAIALHLQYKRSQQKMVPYQQVKGVIINCIATFLHKIQTISQLRVKILVGRFLMSQLPINGLAD